MSDGKNLFLVIKTNGSKYWRFKYVFNNKEKLLALGVYPEVSIAKARERRRAYSNKTPCKYCGHNFLLSK